MCYSLWNNAPMMLPATSCNTQSSAPEDGQNNCPKHVELTGIINKSLLSHLVGCLYYLYQWCTVKQVSDNEIYLLIKYIKRVLWRVAKRLSYIEDARCLKLIITIRIIYCKCVLCVVLCRILVFVLLVIRVLHIELHFTIIPDTGFILWRHVQNTLHRNITC